MDFLLGAAALVSSALGYAWALGLSRSETAPAWAHRQLFATVISLIIVALIPTGVGFVAYGFGKPFDTLSWIGLAVLGASVPVLWLAMPALARRRRRATDEPLPAPPSAPEPVDPDHKMAA